jgi:hypothetical protein
MKWLLKKLQVGKNGKHLFNITEWLPKILLLPVSIIPQLVQESEKEILKRDCNVYFNKQCINIGLVSKFARI